MAYPTTTIETTQTSSNGDPPMIIRQPVTLAPRKMTPPGRPRGAFSLLTDSARGHLIAMIGEFLGTTML